MSGKGPTKRGHADARRAAKMKAEGFTARQIAEALGKKPEQVRALVLLGQRLSGAAEASS